MVIDMIRIMVVEDDYKLNSLIKKVLEKDSYVVDSFFEPLEALEKMTNTAYDLIISDIMMPNMNGFDLAKTIRLDNKEIPILFITAKDEFEDKKRSYLIGVDDYMVKPIDINELVLRVGALLKRAKINNEHKLVVGSTTLDHNSLSVVYKDKEIILPLKEFMLLHKMLSYPGKTFTRQQLLLDVWGYGIEGDTHTVDVHIERLRKKFKDNADFEIITIRGIGYKVVKKCEK